VSAVLSITLNDGNTIPQLGFGIFQRLAHSTSRALFTGVRGRVVLSSSYSGFRKG